MKTVFPDFCVRVLSELTERAKQYEQDAEFRFVGGCVRDAILGREPKDWDLVTNVGPLTLTLMGMDHVGQAFPVFLYRDPEIGTMEVACCRTERKTGTGHNAFETVGTRSFEEDALRRDLTINTMWYTLKGVEVYSTDVYEDLTHHRFCAVTEAFAEDPLRVFRVARFMAQFQDWKVGLGTISLMASLKGELKTLAVDRVRNELEKALMAPKPSLFFQILREADALDHWFPEVKAWIGVDHSGKPPKIDWHPEGDVWNHMMMVLDRARELGCDLSQMYGALGHDFGKPLVPREKWPSMPEHEVLGKEPIMAFCARLNLGAQIERMMTTVAFQHTNVHRAEELRAVTMVRLCLAANRTVIGVEGLGQVCMADAQGRAMPFTNQPYPSAEHLVKCWNAMKEVKFDGVPNMSHEKAEQMYVKALKGVHPKR